MNIIYAKPRRPFLIKIIKTIISFCIIFNTHIILSTIVFCLTTSTMYTIYWSSIWTNLRSNTSSVFTIFPSWTSSYRIGCRTCFFQTSTAYAFIMFLFTISGWKLSWARCCYWINTFSWRANKSGNCTITGWSTCTATRFTCTWNTSLVIWWTRTIKIHCSTWIFNTYSEISITIKITSFTRSHNIFRRTPINTNTTFTNSVFSFTITIHMSSGTRILTSSINTCSSFVTITI